MADGAAGGGAEDGVVPGDVATDAADRGALQAALRVADARQQGQRRRGDSDRGETEFHGKLLSKMVHRLQRRAAR